MKSILKNSKGNAVSVGGKLLGKPEGIDRLKKLLDTTKSTQYLFSRYTGTSVDGLISYNDMENVEDMGYMFRYCSNLTTTPLLNTSNVNNMGYVFQNCYALQTIDITSMDKITSTTNSALFASGCSSLTKLIIRTMTKIPSLNTNSFNSCYHFTGTAESKYNPDGLKDGRIYVPDDKVEELKQATNWSAYADIIVPLSTLEE